MRSFRPLGRRVVLARLVAVAACVLLAVIGGALAPVAVLAVLAAVLVATVVVDVAATPSP